MIRVRYYGHIGSLSGYGRAAADMCMALLSTGQVELEISPIDYRADQARIALAGAREVLVRHCRTDLREPDVVIIHTLPNDMVGAHERVLGADDEFESAAFVAYTTWEGVTAPPSLLDGYGNFQQLWMPSSPGLKAFAEAVSADKDSTLLQADRRVIPHAFDADSLEARRRPLPGAPDTHNFNFYYIGAWNSRKNPAGLIRAWAMAFEKDARATLTLHCPGATSEQFGVALHQTGLSPSDMAPIVFSNKAVAESEIWKMHAVYDCFVTASRGEAWNLPAFDAALAGRAIISTGRLGSDDYLYGTSAHRIRGIDMPATVDVQVTSVDDTGMKMRTVGGQGLTSRSTWVEPDLVEISQIMLMLGEYSKDRDLVVDNNYDLSRYSYESVGKLALAALEDIS